MPLIAMVDGVRATATKDGTRRGSCVDCGGDMLARTGEVVTWHWAHMVAEDGEPCHPEPETEWHLGWKSRCPDPDRIEVTHGNRRADLMTPYGWAVEFQHSSLDVGEVRSRERDWRGRMVWVVDGTGARDGDRLTLGRPPGRPFWTLRWAWCPAWVRELRCRTFIDLGDGRLVLLGKWFDDSSPAKGYGWVLSEDEFVESVINGSRPPVTPRRGSELAPAQWATRRGELVDCPTCAGPLAQPPARRCSADRFHRAVAA